MDKEVWFWWEPSLLTDQGDQVFLSLCCEAWLTPQ